MEEKLLGPRELREALAALGEVLSSRGTSYEVVIVGGAALALRGVVQRPTRDVDVVALHDSGRLVAVDALPRDLAEATADVARIMGLRPTWLNVGPRSLLDLGLPSGFESRLTPMPFGGLLVHVAGREDQIAFKLYAAVDQGPRSRHFADLRTLQPTLGELETAARWTRTHDPSEGFLQELVLALRSLGVTDVEL